MLVVDLSLGVLALLLAPLGRPGAVVGAIGGGVRGGGSRAWGNRHTILIHHQHLLQMRSRDE
jgi:hypothetical protein